VQCGQTPTIWDLPRYSPSYSPFPVTDIPPFLHNSPHFGL
jgi:hypothetical protein